MQRTLIKILLFALLVDFSYTFLDIEELKSSNFGVEISNKPVVLGENVELPGTMQLTSVHGQQYQCVLPNQPALETQENIEQANTDSETGIPELLSPMEDGPCLTYNRGWWTYEFCYRKYIKQYHVEEGKIVGEIIFLGYYENDFDWLESPEKSAKYRLNRYHSQQYVNGSICDLSGKPRRAEVRFICQEGSGDQLFNLNEPEVCIYNLYVHTMRLCHHPYLRAPRKQPVLVINCSPLLSQEEFDIYLTEKQEEEAIKALLKNKKTSTEEAELSSDIDEYISSITKSSPESLDTALTPSQSNIVDKGQPTSQLGDEDDSVESMTIDVEAEVDANNIRTNPKLLSNFIVEALVKALAEEEQALIARKASENNLQISGDSTDTTLLGSDETESQPEDKDGEVADDSSAITESETSDSSTKIRDGDSKSSLQKDEKKTVLVENTLVDESKQSDAVEMKQSDKAAISPAHDTDDPNDEIYDDDEAADDFEEGLNKLDPGSRERFAKFKGTIDSFMQTQFSQIVDEAQAEMNGEAAPLTEVEKLATYRQLSQTLHKLLERLDNAKRDAENIDNDLERIKKLRENLMQSLDNEETDEDDKDSASSIESKADTVERSSEVDSKEPSMQAGETDVLSKISETTTELKLNDGVKVRITRIKPSSQTTDSDKQDDDSLLKKVNSKKLEQIIKALRQEQALDEIVFQNEVRIVTAGYYDEENNVLHVEPSHNTHAFKKILVAVLGFNTDQLIEQERQEALEEGYNFQPIKRRKKEEL